MGRFRLLNINHHNLSFINKDHLDYMIYHSDLSLVDKSSSTALIYATQFQNDNLSDKAWKYLIDNSDLNQFNNLHFNPLLYSLTWRDQFKYLDILIKKTSVFNSPSPGAYPTALYMALVGKISLPTDIWDVLIDKSLPYCGCAFNYSSWCAAKHSHLPIQQELKLVKLDPDLFYSDKGYKLPPEIIEKYETYPTIIDPFLDRVNIHLSTQPFSSHSNPLKI